MDAANSAAAREAAPGLRLADFAAFSDAHARLGPDALHANVAPPKLSAHAALLTRRGAHASSRALNGQENLGVAYEALGQSATFGVVQAM